MPRHKDESRAILLVAMIFALFALVVGAVYFIHEHLP
jgi:hypothetical protein